MADPLFGPEVRQMLQENDAAGLKVFCDTLHPATVAEALGEGFEAEEVWRVLQTTDIKTQATIFEYFPIELQVKMVEGIGRQQMAKLIEQMSHDDRVDLLRRLRPRIVEQLLRLVDEADRRDIASLTKYAENTAGALMTTDYAWVPANISVSDALERLRLQAPDRETIYYVYVLDEHRHLLGMVSLRDVILASRHAVIRDIMQSDVVTAQVDDDREQVAQQMARYDFLAMPVVDSDKRLVGIITHDDVIDVMVEEATEDVQRMAGVGVMVEDYLEANLFTVWKKRAVWLACLFGAELLTYTMLSHFEDTIKAVVVLALFIPLCISTGGNSGSQAATLITRAMALGQISTRDWWRVLRHELAMGLILGLTLGVIGFVRGAATSSEVLHNTEKRKESFKVIVPKNRPLQPRSDGKFELPPQTEQTLRHPRPLLLTLPKGGKLQEQDSGDDRIYTIPEKAEVSYEVVDRWHLGLVIAQAVAMICLWGTLVGAMLPLAFRRLGFDPAFASSPFVATFVDVTGIFIFFTIAIIWIPGL
ncbi:MAG TPA: magnesium transporter [Gemmataceae bacterium]|nr:magnesium transporter [Gemmataceae bacterium]